MDLTKNEKEKIAVVIIHGMGEQQPMETLRGFANSIIPDIVNSGNPYREKFYVKPDSLSELFDLRRITAIVDNVKADFYEYYWAHLMRGSTNSDTLNWIAGLFRRIRYVPARLRLIHSVLLFLFLATIAALVYIIKEHPQSLQKLLAYFALGAGIGYFVLRALRAVVSTISINILGDAARYFTPKPGNVINRQQIRQEGLTLLHKLHGRMPDGTFKPYYDRVIIVAHSLGSVIAYDLVSILWSNYNSRFDKSLPAHQTALATMEKLTHQIKTATKTGTLTLQDLKVYEDARTTLRNASMEAGNPWRISDFITMGSPLSHAQLLMARGKNALDLLQKERQFPTCPPILEAQHTLSYKISLKFSDKNTEEIKVPHHAALFALTSWTNIWFKNDYVGGPMKQSFGQAVNDIGLSSKTRPVFPFLSHTSYWDKQETQSVETIRSLIFNK